MKGKSPFTGLRHFLGEVRELGLRIFVTELDVNEEPFPADIATRNRMVAGVYRDYLHTMLEERHVEAVLTWELSDRDSWLRHREKRTAGAPGLLPFDDRLQPKPAFFAMREELKNLRRRVDATKFFKSASVTRHSTSAGVRLSECSGYAIPEEA